LGFRRWGFYRLTRNFFNATVGIGSPRSFLGQIDIDQKERAMTTGTSGAGWSKAAMLVGRLISAAIFIVAASFKFYDTDGTLKYIIAEFPASKILAWLAAGLGGAPDGVRMLR
jgi:hypothetical protein